MRLFLAVPVPAPVLEALRAFRQTYETDFTRLVPEENLHLTLHFIGEAAPDYVAVLAEKVSQITRKLAPFNLTVQEIAPGPKLKSPRLVWVRFQQHPAFEALATNICAALDVKPHHGEFIPHITMARFRKDIRKPKGLPILTPAGFPDFMVQSVAIWESKLKTPHPQYNILYEFQLNGSLD